MEDLFLEGNNKLPKIAFNRQTGILLISGRCIPEDSIALFRPLKEWIKEYAQCPNQTTVLDVSLEYFNTSSSKHLFELFKNIELIHFSKGSKVNILWKYEKDDENIFATGEDYASILNVPFELVEIKD